MQDAVHRCTAFLTAVIACINVACGSNGSTPAEPSPPTTTIRIVFINVTSTSAVVVIGSTLMMSAIATQSDGTTTQVSAGTWGVDNPSVANINPATGLVQPIAPGAVTVFVDFQGIRGTKLLRVVPNYGGLWRGSYTILSCVDAGNLAGTCNSAKAGAVSLDSVQAADAIQAVLQFGSIIMSATYGSVSVDGSLQLSGQAQGGGWTYVVDEWINGPPTGNSITATCRFTQMLSDPLLKPSDGSQVIGAAVTLTKTNP